MIRTLTNISQADLTDVLLSIANKDIGDKSGWVVEEIYAPKVLADLGHEKVMNLNEIINNFKMFDFISQKDGIVYLTSIKYSSSLYRDSVNSIANPGDYLETTLEVLNKELKEDNQLKSYFNKNGETKISLAILYFTHDIIKTIKDTFRNMYFVVEYFHTNMYSKFKVDVTCNKAQNIEFSMMNDFTKIHASIADKAFKVEVYEHILSKILSYAKIKQTNNIATVRSSLNKKDKAEKEAIEALPLRKFIDAKIIRHDLLGEISINDLMGYPKSVRAFLDKDKRDFKQYRKLFFVQKNLNLKDHALFQHLNDSNKGGKKITKTDIFASVIMGYAKNRETLTYSANIGDISSKTKLMVLKDMIESERGHTEDGQKHMLDKYNKIIDMIKGKEKEYMKKGFDSLKERKLYLAIINDIIEENLKMQQK